MGHCDNKELQQQHCIDVTFMRTSRHLTQDGQMTGLRIHAPTHPVCRRWEHSQNVESRLVRLVVRSHLLLAVSANRNRCQIQAVECGDQNSSGIRMGRTHTQIDEWRNRDKKWKKSNSKAMRSPIGMKKSFSFTGEWGVPVKVTTVYAHKQTTEWDLT